MSDSFDNLNLFRPRPTKKILPGRESGLDLLAGTIADKYTPDLFSSLGDRQLGKVLRVESGPQGGAGGSSINILSWLGIALDEQESQPPSDFIQLKVYIEGWPSSQGGYIKPPPRGRWGDSPSPDHSTINKFDTFIATSNVLNQSGIPKVGDLVWVTYRNIEGLEDPIYLGPVNAPQDAPIFNNTNAAGAFACSDGLHVSGAPGSAGGSGLRPARETNQPVARIGPSMPREYVSIDISSERGSIPRGKGVFLEQYTSGQTNTSRYPVKDFQNAGIKWVAIRAYRIKKAGKEQKYSPSAMKTFIDELHKGGIKCYLWGWSAISLGAGFNPSAKPFSSMAGQEHVVQNTSLWTPAEDLFIKNMVSLTVSSNALGIIIDSEGDMNCKGSQYGSKKVDNKWIVHEKAQLHNRYFAHTLKSECDKHGIGLGFTGITAATTRSGYYYYPWAEVCQYAIPQTYSGTNFYPASHWKKGYDKYFSDWGFKKIIPGMGAYNVKTWQKPKVSAFKSPNRMRWELHACYSQDIDWHDAVCWWSWRHAKQSNRMSVIKELSSDGAGSSNLNVGSSKTTKATINNVGPPAPPEANRKDDSAEVVLKTIPYFIISDFSLKSQELSLKRDFNNPNTKLTDEEIVMFTGASFKKIREIKKLIESTPNSPEGLGCASFVESNPDPEKGECLPGTNDLPGFKEWNLLIQTAKMNIINLSNKKGLDLEIATEEAKIMLFKKQQLEYEHKSKIDSDPSESLGVLSNIKVHLQGANKRLADLNRQKEERTSQNPRAQTVANPCGQGATYSGQSIKAAHPIRPAVGPLPAVPSETALKKNFKVQNNGDEKTRFKPNRVRAFVYGVMDPNGPLATSARSEYTKQRKDTRKLKMHVLVAKRFNMLCDAWMESKENDGYTKHKPQVNNAWGPPGPERYAWLLKSPQSVLKALQRRKISEAAARSSRLYQAVSSGEKNPRHLFKLYLEVKYPAGDGSSWLSFDGPHITGLAVDIFYKTKEGVIISPTSSTNSEQKSTKFYKWMQKNAWKYGFSPYVKEAWHWEVQMPTESYRTGVDWVTDGDYSVWVEERSKSSGRLTSSSWFANNPFV